jgi:hypothetical protein
MSERQPGTPGPGPWGCLGVLGLILLLPGLCSLVFAFLYGRDLFVGGFAGVLGNVEGILWVFGVIAGAAGVVALTTAAIRRRARS